MDHFITLERDTQKHSVDLERVNCNSIPYTLASFCVIKQSWRCLVKLLQKKGLPQLEIKPTLEGFEEWLKNKTPKIFAEEC